MSKKYYSDNGTYAEVVAHSVSPEGKEIITYSLKYGLIVHSEKLRHRLFSNSVKSNRAVSSKQIRKEVLEDPYVPVKFGGEQRGMVSSEEYEFTHAKLCRALWRASRYPAVGAHWMLCKLGLHKEVANRILNPWQWVRCTTTFTEGANFYDLRLHKDAQKDIKVLAEVMEKAHKESTPIRLLPGEWHVPYVTRVVNDDDEVSYLDNDGKRLTTQQAKEASAARCARSSYDTHDGSKALYEKPLVKGRDDKTLFQDLITSKPTHGSPAEHQATPMEIPEVSCQGGVIFCEEGVTHIDSSGSYWSGNFKGWIQHRQLLKDHCKWET